MGKLIISQLRYHHLVPHLRFIQSPPYLRPCTVDTMADVLGRHFLLLPR